MTSSSDRFIADVEKARVRLIQLWIVSLVVFVTVEALRGAHYWNKVKGPYCLFEYGSSLDYFVAGEFALVNAALVYYYGKISNRAHNFRTWAPWLMVGLSGVYFAADEFLCIHKKLGASIEHTSTGLLRFFPAGGDTVVTATYVAAAAVCMLIFFNRMMVDRTARTYAFVGMGLLGVLATLDIVPKNLWIGYMPFRETKELVELSVGWVAGATFISASARTFTEILRMYAATPAAIKRKRVAQDSSA
jgi:hypothetical protein